MKKKPIYIATRNPMPCFWKVKGYTKNITVLTIEAAITGITSFLNRYSFVVALYFRY